MFQKIINQIPEGLTTIPPQFSHLVKKEIEAVSDVNVRVEPGISTKVLYQVKKGLDVGTTTGRIFKAKGGTTVWIEISDASNNKGWVSAMLVQVKNNDAQGILDTIVNYDRATINNLVVAIGLLVKAEKAGINVTKEKQQIAQLLTSVKKRQNDLSSQSWIKITWGAVSDSLKKFVNKLAGYVGIGEPVTLSVATVVAIKFIIAATIGAAITVTVIKYLQTSNVQAKLEFDTSKKAIKEILDKLSPEEKQVLTDEVNKQLEDAYNAGKHNQFWNTYGGLLKSGLWLIAGGFLVLKGVPFMVKQFQKVNQPQNQNIQPHGQL